MKNRSIIDDCSRKRARNITNKAKSLGAVSSVDAAFSKHPVESEVHEGKLEYWSSSNEKGNSDYELGEIVLVNNFNYSDGRKGSLHSFVIMDIVEDEVTLADLEYLCFLVSSNTSKNNNVNPKFPYNEPLTADDNTGLLKDSHVKCDEFFSIVNKDNIIMKIGYITVEQYNRFLDLYELYERSSGSNKHL